LASQDDSPLSLRGADCLVLGAGGFLGLHVCEALVRAGARVHGFGRRSAYPVALSDIRFTTGEFSDRAALARAVEGAELVFHLIAGSTPESSNKDLLGDLEGNVASTLNLLETCRAAQTRKVIFSSSGGTVYGVPGRTPIAEDAPTDPISGYGVGKLAIEKYLGLYRHLHGLDYVVLRIANPFGPYQDPFRRQGVIPAIARAALDGRPAEIWGDGQVVRDFLYVTDVAEAIVRAARYTGSQRIFNVGSGVGRTVLDLLVSIGEVLGQPEVARVHKPGRPADVPVNVLDITLARRELGWEPAVGWQEALRMTFDWLRAQEKG
jgi:UDP-glucose 4-epimerase